MTRLILCLVLLGHVIFCGANMFEWRDNPYDNNDFNTKSEFGQNATLTCENSIYNDTSKINVSYWITPDLQVLNKGEQASESTVDGPMYWIVSDDGLKIDLILVSPLHFGFYYCVLNYDGQTDKPVIVKKALNYLGPYFGELWDKYELSVIIGFSAVGGVLVLLAIGCAIDVFCCPKRAPTEEEWKERMAEIETGQYPAAQDNTGYVGDGVNGVSHSPPSYEKEPLPSTTYEVVDTQF